VPGPNRPFRDNTRLLLIGIAILLIALASLLALASRSATLAPDFLTEVVLYALSATNLTILVALVFVLARNIVKLLVEKRRALPFAHFRAKLVGVLLGMTLIPAVLVLLVGSGLIRTSVDRWFNAPVDDVLSSANAIAGDYYQERQRLVTAEAERLASALGELDLSSATVEAVREIVEPVSPQRLGLVEVYRVERPAGAGDPLLVPIVDVGIATLPRTTATESAGQLASRAAQGTASAPMVAT
jgi:nitrogen fixation/metabolism regulation signal transduction histidine kinase